MALHNTAGGEKWQTEPHGQELVWGRIGHSSRTCQLAEVPGPAEADPAGVLVRYSVLGGGIVSRPLEIIKVLHQEEALIVRSPKKGKGQLPRT